MKFAVTSRIFMLLMLLVVSSAHIVLAASSCRCPAKPNGPGGGVQCEENQIATCDSSSGECDCSCDSVSEGKSMGEYVSLIFSRALGKKVEPSELETPAYHDLVNRFIGSGKDETFHLPKSTPDGKKTQVIIGVPGWLATRVRGSAPM